MISRITREYLETHPNFTASVWRAFRDMGEPCTAKTMHELLGVGSLRKVQASVTSLARAGWLARVSRSGHEVTYKALLEYTAPGYTTLRRTSGLNDAKRNLTACARKASAARRSGSERAMAQALFELEKDLREIRDGLLGE